jgi:hypothetical protein
MAFNDIFRLRIWSRLHGQAMCNVLHFVQIGPPVTNEASILCTDFNTNLGTTYRGRMASSTGPQMEFLECQRIVPYGDVPHIHLWTGAAAGTAIGPCLTGSVAEVVTLYTGQTGRRKRGRIYLGGGITQDMASGQWASAQTTRTTSFVTALMARYCIAPIPSDFRLGVWSRVIAGPAPPFSTDAFAPVISATVRTTVRNQRRRQIGVGR